MLLLKLASLASERDWKHATLREHEHQAAHIDLWGGAICLHVIFANTYIPLAIVSW